MTALIENQDWVFAGYCEEGQRFRLGWIWNIWSCKSESIPGERINVREPTHGQMYTPDVRRVRSMGRNVRFACMEVSAGMYCFWKPRALWP